MNEMDSAGVGIMEMCITVCFMSSYEQDGGQYQLWDFWCFLWLRDGSSFLIEKYL